MRWEGGASISGGQVRDPKECSLGYERKTTAGKVKVAIVVEDMGGRVACSKGFRLHFDTFCFLGEKPRWAIIVKNISLTSPMLSDLQMELGVESRLFILFLLGLQP